MYTVPASPAAWAAAASPRGKNMRLLPTGASTIGMSRLVPRMSSFVMVLTLPSTVSCCHRPTEDGDRSTPAQPVATMRPLVVVELQKAVEGALERSPTGEVPPSKGDAPVLVQDRFLQSFHEAVGPGVARLGACHANAQPFAAHGEGALEFLPVVRQHALQPPAGLAIRRSHDLPQKAEDARRRDLAHDELRPAKRRRHVAAGDLPDLADAFQFSHVETVTRKH